MGFGLGEYHLFGLIWLILNTKCFEHVLNYGAESQWRGGLGIQRGNKWCREDSEEVGNGWTRSSQEEKRKR